MAQAEAAGSTLSSWIDDAARRLTEAGLGSARFDAERLAAHALGLSWSDMWKEALQQAPLRPSTLASLDAILERRAAREPLAYIEGSREFYGLELRCGPGVLVPRPETETLVDVVVEVLEGRQSPVVVDIGTGTGAVALAVASRVPGATVFATDVSEEALVYARQNAAALFLDVRLSSGDLYEALPSELRGRVDVIASNPPYVPDGAGVDPDVRAEPTVAIYGGEIGNDVAERLVAGAPDWLRPGGVLAFEFGQPYQAEVLPEARIRRDHNDRPRVAWRRF